MPAWEINEDIRVYHLKLIFKDKLYEKSGNKNDILIVA